VDGTGTASRKERRKAGKAGKVVSYGRKTSTGTWRTHLMNEHATEWTAACKSIKAEIKSKRAVHLLPDGLNALEEGSVQFSPDAFVDACAEFVADDDQVCVCACCPFSLPHYLQAFNVIHNPYLRHIFKVLRPSLHESDIPSRETLRQRISAKFTTHMADLSKELAKVCYRFLAHSRVLKIVQHCVGKVSSQMDCWSTPAMTPFQASTITWLHVTYAEDEDGKRFVEEIKLRTDLIGFTHLPGSHTGEHMAHAFLFVADRLKITNKVLFHCLCAIVIDNLPSSAGSPSTTRRITIPSWRHLSACLELVASRFQLSIGIYGAHNP
jgi:hypothetical protein